MFEECGREAQDATYDCPDADATAPELLRPAPVQLGTEGLGAEETPSRLSESKQQVAELQSRLGSLQEELEAYRAALDTISSSKAWRWIEYGRSLRNRFFSLPRAGFIRAAQQRLRQRNAYAKWIVTKERSEMDTDQARNRVGALVYTPSISIVMPALAPSDGPLCESIDSVRTQSYTGWELLIAMGRSTPPGIRSYVEACSRQDPRVKIVSEVETLVDAFNRALAVANGEFVATLNASDRLSPDALFRMVELLQNCRHADLIYSDEDQLSAGGKRKDPFFKPDWSPEYLLGFMYTGHLAVYRKALIQAIGGFRPGFEDAEEYDLVLRISERTQNIHHIPRVLYHRGRRGAGLAASGRSGSDGGCRALEEHMERRGIETSTVTQDSGQYLVRPRVAGNPRVSIIIPTKDGVPLLRRCLASIEAKTKHTNYEILIIDNNSTEPATRQFFDGLKHQVIPVPGPFNFSRLNNVAVEQATGEYLLFLNNDTEVISPEWMSAMLGFCQLHGVGMVGAKLLYPNHTIQHAGVILGLGLGGIAGHCYRWLPDGHPGYFHSLMCTRNYSAVTAACCMIGRNVFEQVKGFDEGLPVAYGDVDLCLKVRKAGYRIVYVPHAKLFHHESVSRGAGMNPRDVAAMKMRWGSELTADPFYNPNFSLGYGYSLDV